MDEPRLSRGAAAPTREQSSSVPLTDLIARTALHHYDAVLPGKGKPKESEWTVYAAIVASRRKRRTKHPEEVVPDSKGVSKDDGDDGECHHCWVVSCATGTKCCALRQQQQQQNSTTPHAPAYTTTSRSSSAAGATASLSILHDSHAEVLARRGLVRVLWNEILAWRRRRQQQQQREEQHQPSPSSASVSAQQLHLSSNDRGASTNHHLHSLLVEKERETATTGTKTTKIHDNNDGARTTTNHGRFRLDPLVDLHLYISDSPCGDASIYALQQQQQQQQQQSSSYTTQMKAPDNDSSSAKDASSAIRLDNSSDQLQFTGAKVIVSKHTNVTVGECGGSILDETDGRRIDNDGDDLHHVLVREGDEQLTGKLRTKSGRSNLDADRRSTSMSCSDKLVRWSVLGLQGAVLSVNVEPVRLSSIVVGKDPRGTYDDGEMQSTATGMATAAARRCTQVQALQRAIPGRCQAVRDMLQLECHNKGELFRTFVDGVRVPSVYVSEHTFARGKSNTEANNTTTGERQLVCSFEQPAPPPQSKKRKVVHGDSEKDDGESRKKKENATKRGKASPAAGLSINWQQACSGDNRREDDGVELTVGARGIRHGKKPKCPEDYGKLQSRLSRRALLELSRDLVVVSQQAEERSTNGRGREDSKQSAAAATATAETAEEYCEYKKKYGCSLQRGIQQLMFERGPLAGWLTGDGSASDRGSY